jgi:hypothetical protein
MGSSQPALESSWSAFVAAAEADLSPTVPIMLSQRMLLSVSHPDPARIAPREAARHEASLDGGPSHDATVDGASCYDATVDGGPSYEATLDGTVIAGTVPGGTSVGGRPVGGAARYDAQPGVPAFRPGPVPGRGPGHGRVSRAVRGLLLTPWFAASTGFVIAAGMWLYSPHASITFPSAIGTIHCRLHGCVTPGGKGSGSLASSAPGQRLRTRHERHGSGRSGGASERRAGLTLTFTVRWHRHDSFGAAISISGRRSLGAWQLAFRLPGTQIRDVFGAEWVQSATGDGGTASPFNVDFGRTGDHDRVSFWIIGTGSPSSPTSCTFDGATCTFKVTSAGKDGAPGSGGYGGGVYAGQTRSGR